jgi:asparagine synthase (glutamine-hydrolysing)
MQLIDVNTWLPGDILVKADRMAMAHGLELRTPFLDREVLAVAARLARVEKTAAGTTKFALREAIGELLPQAAAERAKLGFPVPLGYWLRGGMYGFAEQVVRAAQTGQWLDKNAALDILRRFRAEDPGVTWRQVWLLVVFSLWHQIYVERVYDPVALGWSGSGATRGGQPPMIGGSGGMGGGQPPVTGGSRGVVPPDGTFPADHRLPPDERRMS